jgi:hypothetical protein
MAAAVVILVLYQHLLLEVAVALALVVLVVSVRLLVELVDCQPLQQMAQVEMVLLAP